MSISSLQLDAFLEVARQRSFSRAAEVLHVTQSALSQRVLNLEQELGLTLFIREPSGTRLTDAGSEVLRYCQSRENLESELLSGLRAKSSKTLAGRFSVGAFSTIMRSAAIKSLSGLARSHPLIRFEFHTRELRDLQSSLERAECDVIVHTRAVERPDLETVLLGHEEYVLVRPTRVTWNEEVFLDHDQGDMTTSEFLKLQRMSLKGFRRAYFDEIYAIIDGVSEGYGQAVIPRHLANARGIEIVKSMKPMRVPVYAMRFRQAFHTKLQSEAFAVLCAGIKEVLQNM